MARKVTIFSVVLLLLVAAVFSAPAPAEPQAEQIDSQKEDLAGSDKEDLKTAASHWGHGHYGGYGGYGGYGWGGYGGHYGYPGYYGSWGWPHYGGYGYWPYGGYFGHHNYWW